MKLINGIYYIESKKVKVFPCSYRGLSDGTAIFDPESRMNTEYNFIHSGSESTTHDSYIISWTGTGENSLLKCVVGGYYFEITGYEPSNFVNNNSALNLYITLKDIDISNSNDTNRKTKILHHFALSPNNANETNADTDYYLDYKDETVSPNEYYFVGLALATSDLSNAAASLQVVDNSGNILNTSYLPKIYSSSKKANFYLPDGNNIYDSSNYKLATVASTITITADQITSQNPLVVNPTNEQQAIIENLDNTAIKVDLSAVYSVLGLDSPYAWIKRNATKVWVSGIFEVYEFIADSDDYNQNTLATTKLGHINMIYPYIAYGPYASYSKKLIIANAKITLSSICHATNLSNGSGQNSLQITNSPSGKGASADGSVSLNINSTASGNHSFVAGLNNTASAQAATAIGSDNTASGACSFAVGYNVKATRENQTVVGQYNFLQKDEPQSSTEALFIVGGGTSSNRKDAFYVKTDETVVDVALKANKTLTVGSREYNSSYGANSATIGSSVVASGQYSFAQGNAATANGLASHSEGYYAKAVGYYSHAEGYYTYASGRGAHAEGEGSQTNQNNYGAQGIGTHSEGCLTLASGIYSHAEGYYTKATRPYQTVVGKYNFVDNSTNPQSTSALFIVGGGTSENNRKDAFYVGTSETVVNTPRLTFTYGVLNINTGIFNLGDNEQSAGTDSATIGLDNAANANYSLVVGEGLKTNNNTTGQLIIGSYNDEPNVANSLFEVGGGSSTQDPKTVFYITKTGGVSIGNNTPNGINSLAIGDETLANGNYSIAEGVETTTSSAAIGAHAAGYSTQALASYSYAGGYGTIASRTNQTVIGKYNKVTSGMATDALFIVGGGTSESNRKDAFYVEANKTTINGSLSVSNGATFGAGITITGGTTSTIAGNVTINGTLTATSYNATSDRRLKENIVKYIPEKSILDLPVYKFDFIKGTKNNIGCIAQDLQEICPEIVHKNEEGYLSIEENKIVYLLLDEVKKLKKEIEDIKKSIK